MLALMQRCFDGYSNGSGKSSLAMATLWALTGTLDPRPMQDAKVADVVNDDSKVSTLPSRKFAALFVVELSLTFAILFCLPPCPSQSARVSVRGSLNGKPFVITRTKTSTKGALVFHLDGQDLTTQSIKDTQAIIDENLGVGPQIVARTMFHGQFAMNGLLEATDAKFKEELALVVPLSVWQQGATVARAKSRDASKKSAEFEGMIRLRSSDVEDLMNQRDEAEAKLLAEQSAYGHLQARVNEEIRDIREAAGSLGVDVETIQSALETASLEIQQLESQLNTIAMERDSNRAQIQKHSNDAVKETSLKRDELESRQREYDRALLKLECVISNRKEIEMKWNIDNSSDDVDITVPERCPTCKQPISSAGEGHSQEEMQRIAKEEIDAVIKSHSAAEKSVKETTVARDAAAATFEIAENAMKAMMDNLQNARSIWADKATSVERDLMAARNEQAKLSAQIAEAAKIMQQEAVIKSKEATLLEEGRAVEAIHSLYTDLCRTVQETETRLQELRTSGETQRSLSVTMTNLADIFGPRGVQTFLLQNAIGTLQSISQVYLDELSDGSQRLELKLDSGDRISRRALIRGPDGDFVDRPLSSLSGGQWRRCSLALSLGFADLVSRRGRMKTSLCVLDEPLTHLDRSGRSRVGALLRSLLQNGNGDKPLSSTGMTVSTILVILQDLAAEELEESFDHIDEVVKLDGVSTVSIDEQT